MNILGVALSFVVVTAVTWFTYTLDQWLGIVAYTDRYLFFSTLLAVLIAAPWAVFIKKCAVLIGLAAFAILSCNLFVRPPSERILRSAFLRISPGMDAEAIKRIVKEEYDGHRYVQPRIIEETDTIYASLVSQHPGNCTAIIFQIKEGKIVSCTFSAD